MMNGVPVMRPKTSTTSSAAMNDDAIIHRAPETAPMPAVTGRAPERRIMR